MKKVFTFLIISFLFTQTSFAQSQKTFVKSLAAHSSSIFVDLEGAADISEWSETFIRVTTTIKIRNFNEDILKRLISVGRYTLETTTEDGVMRISMPKLARKVTIKGQALNEVLTYEIFVPSGIAIGIVSQTGATGNVN
jgi:hypothetical protein